MAALRTARFWMIGLFVIPPLVLIFFFTYYLSFQSLRLAFFEFSSGQEIGFNGLQNFRDALNAERFGPAVIVTLKIVAVVTVFQIAGGFFLAYFLVRSNKWVQNIGRVAIFIPVVLPGTVVAILWKFIYTPEGGLLNTLLEAIGLGSWAMPWLGTTETSLYASIAVNIWKYVGLTMMLFYLAMQNVSKDQLEAARVDGATARQELWYVYLPAVKPVLEINLVLTVLGSLRAFDIYNMLTNGGPVGSTTTLTKLIVDNITARNYGEGAAMSVMLFAVIALVTVLIRKSFGGEQK
ncbi:carbohydrate ABC transporter permease [Paenibacillus mendelii]|uniref:Carbohydrate ABC transporter permease n=1 Tax=Paenibacillus mendelii TaxID=206163 RepID=A0ABV6JB06_9BACL|nr:sugar ABC transporter permease [Paenibacillus mendelii]